jgi:hypothetical protein
VLAVATLAAALAQGPIALACCLALYGPAAGCALSVAEGVLVESAGASRERTMARVTLAAALGDLAVPLLLGAFAWLGITWRAGFVIAGGIALALAVTHGLSRELDRAVPKDDDEEDAEPPTIASALRVAFGTRPLLGWSFAGTLVGLLDEVLVAFTAVHLVSLGALARAVALAAWIGGGVLGLAWLERRIEQVDPRRVLLAGTALAGLAMFGLALTGDAVLASLLLTVIGATTSTFHPLVKARAYASLPGRPALVNAVGSALLPLDAMAPLLLGAIALRFDIQTVMLLLALAPVGVGLIAWRAGPARSGPPTDS